MHRVLHWTYVQALPSGTAEPEGVGGALAPPPPQIFRLREDYLQSPNFKSLVTPPPPNLEKRSTVLDRVSFDVGWMQMRMTLIDIGIHWQVTHIISISSRRTCAQCAAVITQCGVKRDPLQCQPRWSFEVCTWACQRQFPWLLCGSSMIFLDNVWPHSASPAKHKNNTKSYHCSLDKILCQNASDQPNQFNNKEKKKTVYWTIFNLNRY